LVCYFFKGKGKLNFDFPKINISRQTVDIEAYNADFDQPTTYSIYFCGITLLFLQVKVLL